MGGSPTDDRAQPGGMDSRTENWPSSDRDVSVLRGGVGARPEGVDRLLASGRESRLADLMLVAVWTGLSWSELLARVVRSISLVARRAIGVGSARSLRAIATIPWRTANAF